MDEKIYPQTWYVYTLTYPDNGVIFYVGKGTGPRLFGHEMEARGTCICAKCDIIRSIWTNGKTVTKSIVFETFVEADAYSHESELIQRYATTLVNMKGIPETVRKERNLKEFEKIVGRSKYKSPWDQIYAELADACKYCQFGPGIFIHYSNLFGLRQYSDGKLSGYREEDLIRFKVWMQENYPRVGSAHRELLEHEEKRAKITRAEVQAFL